MEIVIASYSYRYRSGLIENAIDFFRYRSENMTKAITCNPTTILNNVSELWEMRTCKEKFLYIPPPPPTKADYMFSEHEFSFNIVLFTIFACFSKMNEPQM
jgi:hypothetical protein